MNTDILKVFHDKRGDLFPVTFSELPFVPKRMFYVTNVPSQIRRGEHGHYKCRQYYICIKGIIEVKIVDGTKTETIHLTPGKAMLIENMVWSSEKFCMGNDVLLVLCSEEYDEEDYFTDKSISNKK